MTFDPNLATMDTRAFAVAAAFGFIGGLLVPRQGPDRTAVLVMLSLVVPIGIAAWLLGDDPIAGPSLSVGGASALIGTMIKREPPAKSRNQPN